MVFRSVAYWLRLLAERTEMMDSGAPIAPCGDQRRGIATRSSRLGLAVGACGWVLRLGLAVGSCGWVLR